MTGLFFLVLNKAANPAKDIPLLSGESSDVIITVDAYYFYT